MTCTHRIASVGGSQVWRKEMPGCSDCEWDRLVRWAEERRLIRDTKADPAEVSRALFAYIRQLEERRPG